MEHPVYRDLNLLQKCITSYTTHDKIIIYVERNLDNISRSVNEKFLSDSYRQVTDPQIRPAVGDSPVMGIHLALRGPNGTVRLSDPVYVGIQEEEAAPSLTSPS